jgi:hypothetical protein
MPHLRFLYPDTKRNLYEVRYLRQYDGLFLILKANRFFATFIPGLRECVADIIQKRLPDAVIPKLLDGAVLFETDCGYDTLNFFCFNNIFAVIDTAETLSLKDYITQTIQKGISPAGGELIAHNSKKFRTFRIVISQENKLAAIDEKLRLSAEQYIAQHSGLKVDRSNPDAEFWFLCRSEGFSLFMKRLTLRPSWEKSLHPGELPPPLAWMLCHLGNLTHRDTVLDPFCGYGAIPSAALKYFHITRCIACDSDKKAAAYTADRIKGRADQCILHTADMRTLGAVLPEKSVDAIITDPPWTHYRTDQAIGPLYEAMFGIFDTLLKENGRLVILGGRADDEESPLINAAQDRFSLQKHIPILLSGRKAAIFCFGKSGDSA